MAHGTTYCYYAQVNAYTHNTVYYYTRFTTPQRFRYNKYVLYTFIKAGREVYIIVGTSPSITILRATHACVMWVNLDTFRGTVWPFEESTTDPVMTCFVFKYLYTLSLLNRQIVIILLIVLLLLFFYLIFILSQYVTIITIRPIDERILYTHKEHGLKEGASGGSFYFNI